WPSVQQPDPVVPDQLDRGLRGRRRRRAAEYQGQAPPARGTHRGRRGGRQAGCVPRRRVSPTTFPARRVERFDALSGGSAAAREVSSRQRVRGVDVLYTCSGAVEGGCYGDRAVAELRRDLG